MRQYRANRVDNGKKVYGWYAVKYIDGKRVPVIYEAEGLFPVEVVLSSVGQSTGMEDREGVEGYVGDICEHNGAKIPVVIVFSEGAYWFKLVIGGRVARIDDCGFTWKVIGTTTDNPKLLEK